MYMKTIHERLISKLLNNRRKDTISGCWLWIGYVDGDGYGRFGVAYREIRLVTSPHRAIAYLCLGFDIKSETQVLHKCDTPACFNPLHIFFGTQEDNIQDAGKKNRLANQYDSNLGLVENSDWKVQKNRKILEDNCEDE